MAAHITLEESIMILKKLLPIAALAFILAVPAMAEHHEEGDKARHGNKSEKHGEMDKERGEKMAKKLGLSEDQQAKMKAIHEKSREDHKALREQMKKAHQEMREAMKDPKTSESTLRAKHKALKEIMSKQGDLRFEKTLAMRKVLTADQLKEFVKMEKNGKKWKKGDREGKGPRGGKDD
jgi:Spy/CpxP family protein refolding chaperone